MSGVAPSYVENSRHPFWAIKLALKLLTNTQLGNGKPFDVNMLRQLKISHVICKFACAKGLARLHLALLVFRPCQKCGAIGLLEGAR